jgi:hypothetical protein
MRVPLPRKVFPRGVPVSTGLVHQGVRIDRTAVGGVQGWEVHVYRRGAAFLLQAAALITAIYQLPRLNKQDSGA